MKITLVVAVIFAICIACCLSVRYNGNAGRTMDASQGVRPDGYGAPGHPRGHAIGRDSNRFSINSLQDYSRNRNHRTGFNSRADQDRVVGLALRLRVCSDKINGINGQRNRDICVVSANELRLRNFPIQQWYDGRRSRRGYMRRVTIVLGRFRNRNVLHIQTAYPDF